MSGMVFDAGALIAFERNDRTAVMLVKRLLEQRAKVTVTSSAASRARAT